MSSAPMHVVIATDAFKGTMSADEASRSIAAGWSSVRPLDRIAVLPQADGGEGTVDAMLVADPTARLRSAGPVPGPDGRPVEGVWLELPDGTAVVELAQMSGITLLDALTPATASTRGFGEVIAAALDAGASRLVLCLGGSASNDGGAGALGALGVRLLDAHDAPIPDGAEALHTLARVDLTDAVPAPPRGVVILSDVVSPLLGPGGATAVFGPQKGIGQREQGRYEEGLRRWSSLLDPDPSLPGMGAAGGTSFGLSALWDLEVTSGAERIAQLTGLTELIETADVVITGEGRYDGQSSQGKVVGYAATLAARHGVSFAVVAGSALVRPPGALVELVELAGSRAEAMTDPVGWSQVAGAQLAGALAPAS